MQLLVSHGNLPVFTKQWVINENISRRKRQRRKTVINKKKEKTILRPGCRAAAQLYTLKSHYRDNCYCFYIMRCVNSSTRNFLSTLIYTAQITFQLITVTAPLCVTGPSPLYPHPLYTLISYFESSFFGNSFLCCYIFQRFKILINSVAGSIFVFTDSHAKQCNTLLWV
jgi:hypothetical protein